MKIEYNQILLNENAYYYRLKRKITDRDIEVIFQQCIEDKKAEKKFETRVRESFIHGPAEIAKVSVMIFTYHKRPSFLKRGIKNVYETKFGLFVIVESGNFLATAPTPENRTVLKWTNE